MMFTDDDESMTLPPSIVAAMDMVFGVSGWTTTVPMTTGFHSRPSMFGGAASPLPSFAVPLFSAPLPASLTYHPSPISTVDFPLPSLPRTRKRTLSSVMRCRSKSLRAADTCCVCLDPLWSSTTGGGETVNNEARLPACQHCLHVRCLWAVLTGPSLGADSMMRCPLCRQSLDRYDLRQMGYAVGPRELQRVARACQAYRSLLTTTTTTHRDQAAHTKQVAHNIREAATLTARDGFVYNTCILSLDRMLDHKLRFADTLATQIALQRRLWPATTGLSDVDVVASSLACHVDVLVHTARVVAD